MNPAPVELLRGERPYPVRHVPIAVTRGRQTEHHRHTHDFVEIVLVARGDGTHRRYPAPPADAERPAEYPIHENDVLILLPGEQHGCGPAESLEIYNLLFAADLLAGDDAAVGKLLTRPAAADAALRHKLHLRLADRRTIEACIRTIRQELAARLPGFERLVRAKLTETLVLLDRAHAAALRQTVPAAPAAEPTPHQQDAIADAVAFLESHFGHPLSIEQVADAVFLSPAYFSELFKTVTGRSPGWYLNQLRLEHAQLLLLTTATPVTAVAQQSGFCDASHLARAFKADVGVSPRQFRVNGTL